MFVSRNNKKCCRWLEIRQLGAIAGSLLEGTSFPFRKCKEEGASASRECFNLFIFISNARGMHNPLKLFFCLDENLRF